MGIGAYSSLFGVPNQIWAIGGGAGDGTQLEHIKIYYTRVGYLAFSLLFITVCLVKTVAKRNSLYLYITVHSALLFEADDPISAL